MRSLCNRHVVTRSATSQPSGYSGTRRWCASLPQGLLPVLSFATHLPLRFPLVVDPLLAFPSPGHPGSAPIVFFLVIPGPCIFLRHILSLCWWRYSLSAYPHTFLPIPCASWSLQSPLKQHFKCLLAIFLTLVFSELQIKVCCPPHRQSLFSIVVLLKVECACDSPGEGGEKQILSQQVWPGPHGVSTWCRCYWSQDHTVNSKHL